MWTEKPPYIEWLSSYLEKSGVEWRAVDGKVERPKHVEVVEWWEKVANWVLLVTATVELKSAFLFCRSFSSVMAALCMSFGTTSERSMAAASLAVQESDHIRL